MVVASLGEIGRLAKCQGMLSSLLIGSKYSPVMVMSTPSQRSLNLAGVSLAISPSNNNVRKNWTDQAVIPTWHATGTSRERLSSRDGISNELAPYSTTLT